jgi:hypothetical protein
MGIACAKRLMSKYPEDPSLGHSERWEFNPIQYEVLIVAHFSMSFEFAHTTRGLEDYTMNYLMV